MVKKTRYNNRPVRPAQPRTPAASEAAREAFEKRIPVVYGKPFILLEDAQKNTFEFKDGAWVPHAMKIAQCRRECQVKDLAQKINMMNRYEVRAPLPH